MNDTVFLFSSRMTASTDNPAWLIGLANVERVASIMLPAAPSDAIVDSVLRGYKEHGCDLDLFLEAFPSKTSDPNERKRFEFYCRQIIKQFLTDAGRATDSQRNKLKEGFEREEDKEMFRRMGMSLSEIHFKDVYKLKGTELNVYALKEISGEDRKRVRGKDSEKGPNPLWCDLLVDHVRETHPDCSSIRLFLHDQDVPGFSSDSLTCINTVDECRSRGLISDAMVSKLGERNLTITFFMHSNPGICTLIGEDAKIEGFADRFKELFGHMDDISRLKELAKKVLTDSCPLDLECREKRCGFLCHDHSTNDA